MLNMMSFGVKVGKDRDFCSPTVHVHMQEDGLENVELHNYIHTYIHTYIQTYIQLQTLVSKGPLLAVC